MKNEARPESESPHEESIEIHKETEICLDYIRWANCDWRWKKNKSQEEENYSEKACKFFFPHQRYQHALLRRRKSITLLALTN